MNFIKQRILEMFEDGGKLSLSRVSSAAIVISTLLWVSFIVAKTHALPDLNGPALFTGSGAAHYLAGKFGKPKEDPPQDEK